jgi:hypothetical protein
LVRLSQTIHDQRRRTISVSTTPPRGAVWANPLSLAATYGIEVSLFSSGYLDVSVPQVRLHALFIQAWISRSLGKGFPIRISQDHSLVASSPGHFAGSHVLHRLWTPRHPPRALSNLTTPTSNPTTVYRHEHARSPHKRPAGRTIDPSNPRKGLVQSVQWSALRCFDSVDAAPERSRCCATTF